MKTPALGYTNTLKAIRDHVDSEDKGVNEMVTPGGTQKVIFINESGLYALILSSKLPRLGRLRPLRHAPGVGAGTTVFLKLFRKSC